MRIPPYQKYKKELSDAISNIENTPLICIFGSSDHFLQEGERKISNTLKKLSVDIEKQEVGSLGNNTLVENITQGSFFNDRICYIIKRIHKLPSFYKELEKINSKEDILNQLVLVVGQKSPSKPLLKEIKRLGGAFVSCENLYSNEITNYLIDISKELDLNFSRDAIKLIVESIGNSPDKIRNECEKISLLFLDRKNTSLSAKDIAPVLGVLREDQAFTLEKYFLAKNTNSALVLISQLLANSEAPLLLLGVISTFLRKVLMLLEAPEGRRNQIYKDLRIPEFAKKDYQSFLQKSKKQPYWEALKLCHQADIIFKSSPKNPLVILSEIVMVITKN